MLSDNSRDFSLISVTWGCWRIQPSSSVVLMVTDLSLTTTVLVSNLSQDEFLYFTNLSVFTAEGYFMLGQSNSGNYITDIMNETY
jgi:hypothetical protein